MDYRKPQRFWPILQQYNWQKPHYLGESSIRGIEDLLTYNQEGFHAFSQSNSGIGQTYLLRQVGLLWALLDTAINQNSLAETEAALIKL